MHAHHIVVQVSLLESDITSHMRYMQKIPDLLTVCRSCTYSGT